jgi:hypothetical protein
MKEDYVSKMIFTTSFYIIIGIFLGKIAAFYFFPQWWFWTSLLGLALGFSIGVLRFKLKVFESIDALNPGIIIWVSLYFLLNATLFSNLTSFWVFLNLIVLVSLYYVLDKHYKSFSWYRSGRIGFSGLTVLGIFFLSRAAVAATFPNVLSFVGTADIIISAVIAFCSFLVLFNLSKSKI